MKSRMAVTREWKVGRNGNMVDKSYRLPIIRGLNSGEYNIQHSYHGLLLLCFSHHVVFDFFFFFFYPIDSSIPGFSLHGISQGRILEWVVIFFARVSS